MLHSPTPDVVGMAGSSTANRRIGGEDDLSPEGKGALIVRAKDVIAGRIRPPAMVVPPEVDEFLQKEFGGVEPPPTPEAIRRIADHLSLLMYYRGLPVACFTMADGEMVVLASGDREVEALLRGLSEEEAAKVVIADTEPF